MSVTVVVTTEQAKHLAYLVTAAQQAAHAANQAFSLLTLGLTVPGSQLLNVNVDTGVLTVLEPPVQDPDKE